MTNNGTLTRAEMMQLIEAVKSGKVSIYSLPFDLADQIRNQLQKRASAAFGTSLTDAQGRHYKITKQLAANINKFAAYKVAQSIADNHRVMQLFDGDDYVNQALKLHENYYRNWLETEYATTEKMSNSARRWGEIEAEKGTFEFLRYNAVIDGNTRDEHAALDGIIKPVDDDFWNEWMPPNGYNCRCTIDQITRFEAKKAGGVTDLRNVDMKSVRRTNNSLFENNPGKSGRIFKATHPYMDMRKRSLNKGQIKEVKRIEKMLNSAQ